MKSIRNRLLLWLLCGLGVLLVAAGAGVYLTAKESLLSEVDTELRAVSMDARNLMRILNPPSFGPGSGFGPPGDPSAVAADAMSNRWPELDRPGSGFYCQVWSGDGESLMRSASLVDLQLPRPEDIEPEARYLKVKLSGAEESRAIVVKHYPYGRGGPPGRSGPGKRRPRPFDDTKSIDVIVARDLTAVNETLSALLGKIVAVGLAMAVATVFLVTIAVRQGLSPLRRLGEEVAAVDASSLDSRLATDSLPRELSPISNRLNDLIARLEKSFERERRFSSDLAHELRTPIAELRAIAEVSQSWPEEMTPEKNLEILEISIQMQNVVENMLALSRWEKASGEWKPESVAVADLVDECWEPYSSQAKQKGLEVTVAVAPGETIRTDPGLFRHILNNLFSNAVEYTPESGSVSIDTYANSDGECVGMSVSNSVTGLAPDDVSHLFDRFWRHDTARSSAQHSGLGLSLAKACADVLSLNLSAELHGDLLRFNLSTGAQA